MARPASLLDPYVLGILNRQGRPEPHPTRATGVEAGLQNRPGGFKSLAGLRTGLSFPDPGMDFIPSRCALVDKVGNAVLIRGNMPLAGGRFAYRAISEAAEVDLSGLQLRTICLIDNVGERGPWSAEMRAFGADPASYPPSYWPPWEQKDYLPTRLLGRGRVTGEDGTEHPGVLCWWPFEGLPAGEDPAQYLGEPGWDFSGHVRFARSLMTSGADVAVYVHCMLGADRTGAFHAGYLMATRGLSADDALADAGSATSAGRPNADYERLVRAYGASRR